LRKARAGAPPGLTLVEGKFDRAAVFVFILAVEVGSAVDDDDDRPPRVLLLISPVAVAAAVVPLSLLLSALWVGFISVQD